MRVKNCFMTLAAFFLAFFALSSLLTSTLVHAAPDLYYPSGYSVLGSTSFVSGSLNDLQSDNAVYMNYRSYPTDFSTTSYTQAFIGYRSNTGANLLNSPKARGWTGTSWDAAETELPTAGSPVRSVRVAYSTLPQYYDHKIAVALCNDGTLDAYAFNGTSWKVTNNLADLWTTAPTGSQRPYDIAFETSSGNALLVYGWFDDTTNDLAYRRWFAGNQSWSGQVLLDDPTEATEVDYSFILLDNDKTSGSNYIGLIALVTTSSDSLAGVWNGSSWTSLADLSTSVSITSEEDIGTAWAYDGSLMVASGEGANEVVRWRRWTKTSGWGTSATFDMDTSTLYVTNWITIKADPTTDDLMLTMIDSGSDLHAGHWNGATWSITSNIDTNVDTNAQRPADFEWEPTGSRGLLVRGTTAGVITWRTWTSGVGWGADNNPVMGVNTHPWVQLRRNTRNVAGDTKILGAVLESTANDLGAIKWDGTTFTVIGSSAFSADTTVTTYECFDLEFQNFGDPTSLRSEVEFTGSSNTQSWTKLAWTTNSAWTVPSVNATIQLYNYQLGQYPTSGSGFASYFSSVIANTDETKNQTITSSPTSFRDAAGNWKLKITGVKATSTRFNFKADLVSFETSIADITPPAWSNAGTNSTIAGQPTLFYVRWTDNSGLSGFIFGTNTTGTWSNDTWVSMSGTTSWSNVTKTLNSAGGKVVQWRVWANDTSNNWADTGIQSLTTQQLPVASFTYSPTTPYTSDTVTFNASASYDPDGTISSYSWTFGDGTNATGVAASHAYVENGVYSVTLRVTDSDGLTSTLIQSITVLNRAPIASFTQSASTVPTGATVSFNGTNSYDPDGFIASYFWTFGDGTNATGMIANHAYTDNGTYTVTLKVTDNDAAVATSTSTITITNRAPAAAFTSDAATVYTGVQVNFTASSSYDPDGWITSYFWTFGDGTNATGMAVSHAYVDNGLYPVTLEVTDNDGATAFTSSGMTVLNRLPIASFTESASTVYKGETIYFNASASYDPDGSIVSYFWTFGDGTNGTGITVSHSYANVGSYAVILTVTDNDGATVSKTAVKTVSSRPPVANFTASATTVYTSDVIAFNASGSYDPDGTIVTYSWNFGDGSNAFGVFVNHAYSDNGVFTVTLTVTDNDGATGTTQATITVLNKPPVASFTESASTVPTGQTIYFNASASYDSDGSIVSYFWTFGDGTNGTGVQVSHAYADNGVYTVILTVTDNDGATASANATKTVLNRPPVASFSESAQTVYTGQTVTFNASSSNDPDGWIASHFWDFGDGTNATGVVTSHAYSVRGSYTVTLTVTDNDGATATATSTITVVNQPPVASFSESATTVYKGEVIFFNASASFDPDGTIVSYFWTFGDGTNASGVSVNHSYPNVGTYTVTLTVTDNDGATASKTAVKTVLSMLPVANFTQSATTVNTGETVYFNASSSYDPDGLIASYFWTFGDNTNATGVTVSHSYSNDGVYTITLTVTDNDGTTANTTSTLTVLNRPPVASFTESATTVLTGEVIYFNASTSYDSDGFIVNYFWSFGDGTNATGITTSHSYTNNGVYTVTLTVTDDDGSTATTTAIKTVLNRPPVASFTQSTTLAYKGETVRFNASGSFDPDGVIISYFWTFGDGTNATGTVVDHAYTNVGTYTITLTVNDNDNSVASTSSSVTVQNRPPVAQFTQSATVAYTGVVINFNASASYDLDGSIVTYVWTFGDGSDASGVIVGHSYADNGVFSVTLTVTDNDGATATKASTIAVLNRPPIASFTASATTVLTSQMVSLNASASNDPDGSIVSYFWTFGDGTNASGLAANHAYTDNGVYTVTLTVTDNDGAVSQTTSTITVLDRPPVGSFTESAASVLTRQSITFNASASYDPDGAIVSYSWNFGDGNITTVIVPIITHWYTDNGTYTVTLTVTDNDGTTNSSSTTVAVMNRAPVAAFNQSATTIYTNQALTFNASASYDLDGWITAYTWNFGDGNTTTVTTPVVTHVYRTKGTLTVTLTVRDNDDATNSSSSMITVLNRPPIASFTQSATTVYTGESVYFNASASYDPDGTITSYFWTFGDGTSATGVNVSHAYAENAIYAVTLSVIDNDGANGTTSATETVLNRLPVASFTESTSTVYTGVSIQFNASLSYDQDGTIVSYFWTFGDGQNATGTGVTHAYADNGVYTVTLQVTDNDGGTATATATITVVNRAPVASFTESASTVLTGQAIFFNASASYDPDGSIVSYFWTFGDGANASGVVVSHAYADNGVYIATLTVTDNDGAPTSTSATKTVLNRPPVAIFAESAEFVYIGETITFNASQSYDLDGFITSYFWTFGDGTNGTGIIVTHAYSSKGVFTVTLTVTDNDGASATASALKTVGNKAPVASFAQSTSTALTDQVVYFDASTSSDPDGVITNYFWEFGDSTNATGITSSHSYDENGVYTVKLTVTDNDGAKASITSTVTVLNRAPIVSFTESASTVLTGETIYFNASASYDPDGVIVSYSWTFGDGATATGAIVSHAYVENGVYTVTLTVTDNDGATASTTATKTVLNRPPLASFTQSATTVLTGVTVQFNASASSDPDGSIVSYFWTFGDGTNASGVIVSHSYADNGVYTVTLTVTDNDGATATALSTVTVLNRPPVAAFTPSATQVLTGEIITFNAAGSYDPDGFILNYFWTFGDGVNATGNIVQHSYATKGVYNVLLTLTDNDGATATATTAINVQNQLPTASYTYSPSFQIAGQVVTFNASSSRDPDGSIVSYMWNFGDGNVTTVTASLITHIYSVFGNYSVTLTVTDNDGGTATSTQTTRIRDYPTADFSYSPSSPIAGQTVTFNATLSTPRGGTITNYMWNFGDGTPQFNTANPIATHTYSTFGNYTVTLTVSDSEGLSATTASAARVRDYPSAAFTSSPSYPIEKETVTFDASSSTPNGGIIASYRWNFGDGNITTVTTPIVTHAYSSIGNYTATLTVYDDEGLSSGTSRILSVRGYPIAVFSFKPSALYVGDAMTFNASLSSPNGGAIVRFSWNFGDGTPLLNLTSPTTTHIYALAGNLTVTLTVTDSEGLSSSVSHSIIVSKAPVAVFSYSPQFPKVGEKVTFNASASYDPNGYVVSYRWNFGDGNVTTVTTSVITHSYASTGTYTVTLTVTDNGGYVDAATRIVTLGTPKASFTYQPPYPIASQSIVFNASSSYDPNGYIVSYVWNFGDGNVTTVTSSILSHFYRTSGSYTVTLTVADNDGLTDTTTRIVSVAKAPVASFTYTPATPYVGDTVNFNASSSTPSNGSIISFLWNFGDGSPIQNRTTPTTTHVYASSGNYTVSLAIKDSMGRSNTVTKTVSVLQSPVAAFTYSPASPKAFDTITFNASASYDTNGNIVSYVWNFADGNITSVTNSIITHVYRIAGNYSVVLIVSDNQGYTNTITRNVYVSLSPPVSSFTSTPVSPIARQLVTFNASSSYDLDGSIANYKWDFGDGNVTTVTTSLITHKFSTYGNYTVTLTVTDNDGLTNAKTATIRVRDYPTATFVYTPTAIGVGNTVVFNASSSTPNGGTILSYLWNFGDGTSTINTTNPIVTHVFNTLGNYTISLTVTDSEGLSTGASKPVYVAAYPVASFTFSPKTPYVGDTVTFNASQSYDPDGYIVSYLWNFGDGSPLMNVSTQLTTHVFIAGGNYTVSLTVKGSRGLSSSTSSTVGIGKAPVAAFTYSPSIPIAGQSATFNASSSYDARRLIANYTWNFGDGSSAVVTTKTTTHVYAIEGNYTVTLKVTDTAGYTDTVAKLLRVRNYPVAAFTFSPSYPIKGQDTAFDASTSQPRGGVIVSYQWNFGDGSPLISTNITVTKHAYLAVGTYNVTLTVTDSEGLSSILTTSVKVRDYPTAAFTWVPNNPLATQPATFDASLSQANSGVITGYMWNFDDGTIATATTPTITHAYSIAKNYIITLTVVNSEGLSSFVSKSIIVIDAPPTAAFTYTPSVPLTGQIVAFDASASTDPDGSIVSYVWNFGDGNITTVTTPTIYHKYTTAGNFTLTLTVKDNAGLTGTVTQTLEIITYPTASFAWSPSIPGSTATVTFNASASKPNSGFLTSYAWNFGDGNTTTITTALITHRFSIKGNYTVSLTVTNSKGLSNSKSQVMTVVGTPPIANFVWQPTIPQAGQSITFDASTSLARGGIIAVYRWDFGDGTPIVLVMLRPTTTHVFATYGQFTVTLTVSDSEGLNGTRSGVVSVAAPPHADFTWSPQSPKAYQAATLNASASTPNGGSITSYSWNFGDGNLTSVSSPAVMHVYKTPGNYTVVLTVTDTEGLSDTISKVMTVLAATSPQADFVYSPSSPYIFQNVVFNASASVPGTGNIVSYAWSFGDSSTASVTVPIVSHVYQTSGNFTVTLTVTNIAGLTGARSKPVSVLPISGPKADFTWSPTYPQPNKTASFDGSISTPGWNGSARPTIVTWRWNFGDGNITTVTVPYITHIYKTTGTFTVVLTVTDVNGATNSKTDYVKVTSLLGDINGDGKVDIRDLTIIAVAYGSYQGGPKWNPAADLNGDGKIDIRDLAIAASQYGKTST